MPPLAEMPINKNKIIDNTALTNIGYKESDDWHRFIRTLVIRYTKYEIKAAVNKIYYIGTAYSYKMPNFCERSSFYLFLFASVNALINMHQEFSKPK